MDDLLSYLQNAAQAATTIGSAVTNATKTAAANPTTATPAVSTTASNKMLYIIGGIVVAGLALLLIIPRLLRK